MEKIIVFSPTLNIGGIERVLFTYAKGLANKGYNVIFLTLSHVGDFEFETIKNLHFHDLRVKRLRFALFALIKFLKAQKPDIIFCANDATFVIYLAQILSRTSVKIISSQHNYYEDYLEMNIRTTFVPKYIYPLCYKVVAVSEGIRSMLINEFKIKANNVVTIYNPIDLENIIERSNSHVVDLPEEYILFVGRFEKVKGIDFLINSYYNYNKKYPNVKLLLIGDGSELQNIINLISGLNLNDRIKILGKKDNPYPYLKKANIVALSSVSEAFPVVLLEALALGRTVVSTPTLGALNILENGKYGYVSDSISDINEFYDKLVEAYQEPLDPTLLTEYSFLNYNIDLKTSELERLWKGE